MNKETVSAIELFAYKFHTTTSITATVKDTGETLSVKNHNNESYCFVVEKFNGDWRMAA